MTAGAAPPVPARVPMHTVGLVVLAAVFCYFAFVGVDTFGLESKTATARVVSTGYRAAGRTYVTEIINNRPLVLPQTTPEVFLAQLDIEGTVVTASIDKALHEGLRPGEDVQATVMRTRLTGRTNVVEVRRTGLGPSLRRPR